MTVDSANLGYCVQAFDAFAIPAVSGWSPYVARTAPLSKPLDLIRFGRC
jgi:hypothetical protein